MKKKDKILILTTVLLMIVTIIVGFTYSYIGYNKKQENANNYKSNCYNITYNEAREGVTTNNAIPMSDEDGLSQQPYTVTMTNHCNKSISYNLYLNVLNDSTTNDAYMKIANNDSIDYLTNFTKNNNPSLAGAKYAYLLENDFLLSGQSKTFNLRSWMASEVTDGMNTKFSNKITIEAVPSQSQTLASTVLKTPVNQTPPTSEAFRYGEPSIAKNISGKTYQEYEDAWTGSINSSSDKAVGSSYTFDTTTGYFTLSGTTATSVSYSSSYVGYYTCVNNNTSNCEVLYKIETVSGTNVTKATRITSGCSISGSGLFSAPDDEGTSYYYRGEVDNNYVSFGTSNSTPLIWRIVRINGDGTIRLITDNEIGSSPFNTDSAGHKYVGYTYDNSKTCTKNSPCNGSEGTNSTIKTYLENFYTSNLQSIDNKLATTTYCNDTTYTTSGDWYYYGAHNRISSYTPQLTCPDTTVNYGGNYKLKIGLMSADELMMAGYGWSGTTTTTNYLGNSLLFKSASPNVYASTFANAFYGYGGQMYNDSVAKTSAVRPVINLKSDVVVTDGNGTKDHPFVIAD